ncbi:MAG: hypothetical protein GX633_05485, partial [Clostridiales bacterium]|nr:hypothetical protein [Clostridiales bacterium]
MTGYIRPFKPELRIKEYEAFRAVYCGLCHTIRKRYGAIYRLALTFDMCFLALFAIGANDTACKRCKKRCIVSPVKKKSCIAATSELEYAADVSIIYLWLKLDDRVRDSKGLKRLFYRILRRIVRGKFTKAAACRSNEAQAAISGITMLNKLEERGETSLDRAASAFSDSIEHLSMICKGEKNRRVLSSMLRQLGRFIYILDACDDMDEDKKEGSYNAVLSRFPDMTDEERKQEVKDTLEMSLASIAASFELAEVGDSSEIVRNIVYLGLPAMVNQVIERKKDNDNR